MPAALEIAVRQQIHDRWRGGLSAQQIAAELHLPARSVRHLLARFRQRPEAEALGTDYSQCGPTRARLSPLYQACVRLRLDNPDWGAGRIRVELASACPGLKAPPRA